MSNAVIRKAIAADATGIAIVAAYTWATAYSGLLPDSLLKNRIVDKKSADIRQSDENEKITKNVLLSRNGNRIINPPDGVVNK